MRCPRFPSWTLCVTLAAVSAAALVAQENVSSPLLAAVSRAPTLEALHKRVEAAQARTASAGRLADPEIEGMASRANMVDENRNVWEVTVRQPLPRRGERAADRDRAQAAVAMAEADYAAMAGEMAADVAMALAEADGADARIKLLDAQLARLGAVLQTLESRLASGSARIADRLTVQSRVAAMQLMLETDRRMAADNRAEIRARLGLDDSAALPAFAAPAPPQIVATEAAALRLAHARSAEASAMTRMARASTNPMTAVGLRLEREQTRMGNEDMIGVAFMSEIPWRSRSYARADVRAAEADRDAAQAEGHAARFRITNALARVERAERVADTARRLAAETQSRLMAEHDALTRAASVGTGGMAAESAVFHLVDILDQSTETQLKIIEAETAARVARAELWRYAPASQLLGARR